MRRRTAAKHARSYRKSKRSLWASMRISKMLLRKAKSGAKVKAGTNLPQTGVSDCKPERRCTVHGNIAVLQH